MQRDKFESIPIGKYKKRKLKELTVEERRKIIQAYLNDFEAQADVAQRFRVSSGLVKRLCIAFKQNLKMLDELQAKNNADYIKQEQVQLIAEDMLEDNQPIWKATQL